MKRRDSASKIKRLKRKIKRLKREVWQLKHPHDLREKALDDLAEWWTDRNAWKLTTHEAA